MSEQKFLQHAILAVKESTAIFKKYFGRPTSVVNKEDDPRNFVTEIDRKIETQIRNLISNKFPTHKIIGEEFGSHVIKKNDLVWIVDPIDGTTNYIHGLPFCCISIALWDGNGPLVGVVYNPLVNQLFSAVRNQGAFLNGKKISASNQNQLNLAYGGFGWGREPEAAKKYFPRLIDRIQKIRSSGSGAWEICQVANSSFDFHIQIKCAIWDFAAAALIVSEAGGKVTDITGKKINAKTDSIIASNGRIHSQLIKTVGYSS